MPLVPRYTWEEDVLNLALELHLPRTALRRIDIYVSDLVIKVNAAPYVLLLDLQDAVDDASVIVKSIAASNLLQISLKKTASRLWNELQYQGSKSVLRERRNASMERKRASETALGEERKDRRHQVEKDTLRAQMAVDETNRQILTDLKAEERDREERHLYESFRDLQMQEQTKDMKSHWTNDTLEARNPSRPDLDTFHMSDDKPEEEIIVASDDGTFDTINKIVHLKKSCEQIDASPDDTTGAEAKSAHESSRNEASDVITSDAVLKHQDELDLPPPRECIQSILRFTSRVFPTPSRESKAAEEENWLLKNRKHIHNHKGLNRSSGYDISETDPMWLKAKGNDFCHAKDFQSARNAYTQAIAAVDGDNTELMASCLSNRAASLLHLGEFEECIIDCSKALSYLPDTREVEISTSSISTNRLKLKLFVRRGTAYCHVGQYSHATADYSVACSLDSENAQLHDDFLALKALEKAHELKQSGDRIFTEGSDLNRAIQQYSDSLQLNNRSIACLANRAACYLMQHCATECITDCTLALELLQQDVRSHDPAHGLAFCAIGPAAGSPQRRAWVVKTLVRRGAAYLTLCNLDKAEQDFAASVELDPSNEALKADLAKVRTEPRLSATSRL